MKYSPIENGCIICSKDLKYNTTESLMSCEICSKEVKSNAECIDNHFVCDDCHSSDAMDYIEKSCLHSKSSKPVELANFLMRSPIIKMHGPEHHFLVPAVLLTSYYNIMGQGDLLAKSLSSARDRAKNVLGGYCGFFGACGAGIGTGIFMSIVLNSNPLATEEWQKSNMLTSESLKVIAGAGGPRCCKRDTFLALDTAIRFVKNNLNIVMPAEKTYCSFSESNKECKHEQCRYYSLSMV